MNRYAKIREVFSEYFGSLKKEKKLSAGTDIDQLATLIIAMMDGLQIQWLLDPESVSMSKSFNLFSKITKLFRKSKLPRSKLGVIYSSRKVWIIFKNKLNDFDILTLSGSSNH